MPRKDELPDALDFANRLRRVLAAKGYADRGGQDRLGRLLGVKPPTVSAWLSGRHLPSPRKVERLCASWRVPFDWLYWGRGTAPGDAELQVREPHADYAAPVSVEEVEELRAALESLVSAVALNIPAAAVGFAAHLRATARAGGMATDRGLLAQLLGIAEQGRHKGAKVV